MLTISYDELSELNNSITKSFFIYEDELKPVYPYNFAIVNKPGIKLIASTASPISPLKQYVMEIDTTELFNSSLKYTESLPPSAECWNLTRASVSRMVLFTIGGWPCSRKQQLHMEYKAVLFVAKILVSVITNLIYTSTWNLRQNVFILTVSAENGCTIQDFRLLWSLIRSSRPAEPRLQTSWSDKRPNGTAAHAFGHSVIFNIYDPVTLKPFLNQASPSTNPSGIWRILWVADFPCNDMALNRERRPTLIFLPGHNGP